MSCRCVFLVYWGAVAILKLALCQVLQLQYSHLKVGFAIVISAWEYYYITARRVRRAHPWEHSPCQQRDTACALVQRADRE